MNQSHCKIHRLDTIVQFKSNRKAIPFSVQEQTDIYLTSLADMIGKSP